MSGSNPVRRELTVHHNLADDGAIVRAIEALGMRPRRIIGTTEGPSPTRLRYWMLAASGSAALGSEAAVWVGQPESGLFTIALALPGIALAGREVLVVKGLGALVRLRLNISLLMTIRKQCRVGLRHRAHLKRPAWLATRQVWARCWRRIRCQSNW